MKLTDCVGCRDDFYNGKNSLKVKRCWMFAEEKKLTTKFWIDINAPMGNKKNYIKEKRPPCYHKNGGIYCNEIPCYAK